MDEELKILAQKTVNKIFRKIRKIQQTDFHKFGTKIGIGADGTPTSYIDKIAEDTAVSFLKKSKPKVNILSEEAGFLDLGGTYTFVLDPIDGTRNAYRGIPFYSVSLAIGKKRISDIEYGIVKNIPTGDSYIAEKNLGAFLNNKRIAAPEHPSDRLYSCLTLGKNYDAKTAHLTKKDIVRSLGSASLEMCMVATGALDVYIVGNKYIRVVDIAASTLIVREAGGVVKTMDKKQLDMEFNLIDRSSVVAACSEQVIESLFS